LLQQVSFPGAFGPSSVLISVSWRLQIAAIACSSSARIAALKFDQGDKTDGAANSASPVV
jgi:hypothetical protein